MARASLFRPAQPPPPPPSPPPPPASCSHRAYLSFLSLPPPQAEKFPNTLALAQSIRALKAASERASSQEYAKGRDLALLSQDLAAARKETTLSVCRALQQILADIDAFLAANGDAAATAAKPGMAALVRLRLPSAALLRTASDSVRLHFLAIVAPLRFRIAGPFREGGECRASMAPVVQAYAAAGQPAEAPTRSAPGAGGGADIYDIFLVRAGDVQWAKALGYVDLAADGSPPPSSAPVWQKAASALQGELNLDLAETTMSFEVESGGAAAPGRRPFLRLTREKVRVDGASVLRSVGAPWSRHKVTIGGPVKVAVSEDCATLQLAPGKKGAFPLASHAGNLVFGTSIDSPCVSLLYPLDQRAPAPVPVGKEMAAPPGLKVCHPEGSPLIWADVSRLLVSVGDALLA